jgi:plasmid maintenance system antidote protein VapI
VAARKINEIVNGKRGIAATYAICVVKECDSRLDTAHLEE